MKKNIFLIIFLFFLNNFFALTITDDVGRNLELKKPIDRVISLSPAHTEMLYYLNLQDRVIAVSENCDFPSDTKNKIKAGTFLNPDLEIIIKLKPDIVISGGGVQKRAIKKMEELGIKVIVLYPRDINGIVKNMELICELLDGDITQVENFKKDLKKIKDNKKVKTYIELWDKPRMSIGGGSFINDIIEFAGGENIFKDAISEYPKISEEEILKRNPDIILLFYKSDKKNGKFLKIKNYEKKIYVMPEEKQDIFLRPGPRVKEAIEFLSKIYGEINYEK